MCKSPGCAVCFPCSTGQIRKGWIKNVQACAHESSLQKRSSFFFLQTARTWDEMRWEDTGGRKKQKGEIRWSRKREVLCDWLLVGGEEIRRKMPGCLLLVVSGPPPVSWRNGCWGMTRSCKHCSSHLRSPITRASHQLDISSLDACRTAAISSVGFIHTHTHSNTPSPSPSQGVSTPLQAADREVIDGTQRSQTKERAKRQSA